jgi:hypothetical protein
MVILLGSELVSQNLSVEPSFSHQRGFFETPFSLIISDTIPGALITYTRDGSDPSLSSSAITVPSPATLRIDPLDTIGRDRAPSVVIRACAVKDGILLTKVATHTYIFLDKMEELSPDGIKPGPSWPDPNPGTQFTRQGMDYGMDPDVLHDPRYQNKLKESLLSIPTFSIVTDLKNLFDTTSGIYVNALQDGSDWERPTSLELINPDGSPGFQINAGLRIRGAWGRTGINLKHSFRLFFRKEYGQAKLHFPLFGNEGVTEFDDFDLRTSQNYSWAFYNNRGELYTELREVFSRDTQQDMGQPYTRSRYYHLYINGTYWGLYQTQERSEASFGKSYLGGKKEDYDVVKVDVGENLAQMNYRVVATDGDLNAYQQLWEAATAGFSTDENYYKIQGKNPDGSRNPSYPVLIDIDNLIDYMLCSDYVADPDGPTAGGIPNNFYGMRNRNSDRGFVFFRHDAEHSLMSATLNTVVSTNIGQLFKDFNPRWLHQRLKVHPDYHLRVIDHISKHFFNNGALTVQACRSRILKRKVQMEKAVVAESARWGDAILPATSPPHTKDDNWLPEVGRLLDRIIAVRTDTTLSQLKAAKLYTQCSPPVFDRTNGIVPKGSALTMTATNGTIYYTLDGNDTRMPSAFHNVSQALLVPRNTQKRVTIPTANSSWNSLLQYNDTSWSLCESSPGGIGYDLGSTYSDQISFDVQNQMYNVNTSCLIRILFDVTQDQLTDFNYMFLRVQYSDGFTAYLNNFKIPKTAVASRNAGGTNWNSKATSTHDGKNVEIIDITQSIPKLVAGQNLLAIQAMSSGIADSNFFFSVELIGQNTMKSSGPISPSAVLYSAPVSIDRTMKIKARTYSDEQWSAPTEAAFRVMEGNGKLDIMELMYHPLPGESADEKEYEFVDIKNTGTNLIDLSGMSFIEGIKYTFPAGTFIQSNADLLLASNAQVFETRYHYTPFGQYTGQLSNDGETIILISSTGDTIINLTYGTSYPWPGSPDGSGYSLLRSQDRMYQDINDPSSWTASASLDGTIEKNEKRTPSEFQLNQNYPNPFNPRTTVSFDLPIASFVTLQIYDLLGRNIATLISEELPEGHHAREWNAGNISSGVYFYRLQARPSSGERTDSYTVTRKLVLMR